MSSHKKPIIKLSANTFATSDQHLDHGNICKFQPNTRCGFTKDTIKEMNEFIIKQHNERVGPNDNVIFGGDFSFGNVKDAENYLRRMNGIKYGVIGNHDGSEFIQRCGKYFEVLSDYLEFMIDGRNVVVFHYPITEWNRMHHGSYHLFGHVHGKPLANLGRSMDIGLDARPNDLKPWSWAEIDAKLKDQPVKEHGTSKL